MNNEEINIGKQKFIETFLNFSEEVDLLELISNLDKREQLYELMTTLRNKKINNIEKDKARLEQKYLAYLAFDSIAKNTKDSNNIFFYIGWPTIHQQNGIINCRLYQDLETGKQVKIHPFDFEEFEEKNKVIVPMYDYAFYNEDKMNAYNDAREEFFAYLIFNSQENAVEKVLQLKYEF